MYQGIPFPNIDPIIFKIGFFALRWYSLAYIAGFFGGWMMAKKIVARDGGGITQEHVDDFISCAAFGLIIGARLGHVIFFDLSYYLSEPQEILKIWHGGMSFHGGLLGMLFVYWYFAKTRNIRFFRLTDTFSCVAPLGLYFGRLANFINGELWGRITYDVPWAVIFPMAGKEPRHPSQIYEAILEGIVLLIILNTLYMFKKIRNIEGFVSGTFVLFYGIFRFWIEYYREPDRLFNILSLELSTGQILCLPMMVLGIAIMIYSTYKHKQKNVV